MPESQVPAGWSWTNLAALGEYVNGFAFNDRHWSNEGFPIVRIAQITGSQPIVDRFAGHLSSAYRLDDDDIIFSWSGTLAVVRWSGGPAWLNQHLFKVVERHGIERDYLFYLLQRSIDEMDKRAQGSTMKHIKRGELSEFEVAVPDDPEEQCALASVLNALDATIRQTEDVIAKLKQVKQGLLHDLLTRGIDTNGQMRPPQSQAPHLYAESPQGWIPRDWTEEPLEDTVSAPICYGIVQVLGFVQNGVPVLAIKDLNGDFVTGVNRTASSIDAAYSRSRVRPGDVLVSIKGTIGRIGVVPNHYVGNISRDIARLRPRESVLPGFLCQLLRASIGQHILALAQVGTTRAEISIAPLRKLRVPMPSCDEQLRIVEIAEAQDRKISAEHTYLAKLRKRQLGLMDDLLTGRVRVTPLLQAEAAA